MPPPFERLALHADLCVLTKDQSPHIQQVCSLKEMALEAAEEDVQAAVMIHSQGSRAAIAQVLTLLHDRGVFPLIISSRTYPGMASQVYFDSGWGAYRVIHYLLRKGHQLIGFAEASSGHEWVGDRLNSYRNALEAAEIAVRDEWVWLTGEEERLARASDGASAFQAFQRLPEVPPPTAIVASNDVVALGVLQAAREAGVIVPDALSMVGFDNDPEAMLAGLTTVEHPMDALGETAAHVRLERLAADIDGQAVSLRLTPILIERRPVAPPLG